MSGPSRNPTIAAKLARLRRGEAPRVLDLFSGCGGISLGFHRAGCEIIGGVEANEDAARTHAANFHRGLTDEERAPFEKARNICEETPAAILKAFGHADHSDAVDIIVGGPPCQAYARVGRAKLQNVKGDKDAHTSDDRARLHAEYVRFVKALQPVALLMENVPDILQFGGENVAERIARDLEKLGYAVSYTLLNAAAYGVPQTRERFYLLAWHREVAAAPPRFPQPSRVAALPIGYRGTRAAAARLAEAHHQPALRGERPNHYDPCGYHIPVATPAVTVAEAIGDLPRITGHLGDNPTIRRGARRFDRPLPYPGPATTEYAREMRERWKGFTNTAGVKDHVIRALPRDYPIFAAMKPGDEYPAAHRLALQLRDSEVARLAAARGTPLDGAELEALTARMVPPYDAEKFPNKWRKLEANAPARTLMAHLGHDSYSHIHHDNEQARTISVREAARLQSFPDGFVFVGTMNPAFKMIGNAVPPLMAFALARSLRDQLAALAEGASETTQLRAAGG